MRVIVQEMRLISRLADSNVSKRNENTGEYRGADKSLAQPGRKQATATEDFDLNISCL